MVSFSLLMIIQTWAGQTVGFTIGNFSTDIMTLYYQAVYGGSFEQNNLRLQSFLSVLSIGYVVGFLLGSLTVSIWIKIIGYKKTAFVGSIICVLFFISGCFAVNEYYLFVMRFLTGYGSQVMANTIIVLVGEHAQNNQRGLLGVMFSVHVCLGILLATIVLLIIRSFESLYNGWWLTFATSLIWPSLAFITLFFVPDAKIRESKDIAVKEIFQIKYIKVLANCILLGILQMSTGINGVLLYSTQTFNQVFNHPLSSVFGALILNTVNFLSTLIALVFIERLGRKILLFSGTLICCIALIGLVVNFSLPISNTPLLLISSIVFIIGYQFGPGPIFYVFASEILPVEAKGIFTTIINCFNHIPNIFVIFLFPVFVSIKEWLPYATYIIFTTLTTIILFFLAPETKGKSQEEIDTIMLIPSKKIKNLEIQYAEV
ncbi:Sugar transporter family protein [Spironucleus salmonicida]|uniref:Sugar (And other) transporter family protein n=1 Tax=Spironucleus salmonicida TaxID=348837 RepID=V6LDT8_9EUKA|nr:Sugar transporter family protein [Spironucleus salmonicida]|eukprot:EST41851.1 Sugar (and other) transporter family protein [Spironucleus salmonicida]